MSETHAEQSMQEESLSKLFDRAMASHDQIENSKEATNSEVVQMTIRKAISELEKATNLVSISGMFSRNESHEELPTESLRYLLLPVILGSLNLKMCGRERTDVIHVAEIYFKDFLQRCKDYELTDIEIPQSKEEDERTVNRPATEQAKITNLVLTREAKIKRYKEGKELNEKLNLLSKTMSVDETTRREYLITLLQTYINRALDELSSIEQEKPILAYMAKHGSEVKLNERQRPPPAPLKPVIITRDAVQKAVYGAGYPAIPTMTVEEFYDKRVREGTFPASTNIPHTTIQSTEGDADEDEEVNKERRVETDDPEELLKQRQMDEYKDDHRRGWGNRHNRS